MQVIKQIQRKLPPGYLQMREEEEEEQREYRLGNIPPKTSDPEKFQNDDDKINYKSVPNHMRIEKRVSFYSIFCCSCRALCQGKRLLPEAETATLKCYYTHLDDGYFAIGPMKVEVQHRAPHLVLTIYDVIWDSEIAELIKLASPRMATASVGQDRQLSDLRYTVNWRR